MRYGQFLMCPLERRKTDRFLPRSIGGGAACQAGADVSDAVVPTHWIPVLSGAHASQVAVGEQRTLVVRQHILALCGNKHCKGKKQH